MRQLPRDGKKQATTFFCCSECYQASYKRIGWYDGKADIRRQEKERNDHRDRSEYNRQYRESHREELNAKRRERYWKNHEEELAANKYARKKRKLLANNKTV